MKEERSFTIPLPRFTFKQTGANGFLVISLVIFAFVLGMLTNKVMYLQQVVNTPTPTSAQGQAAAPTPPPVVKNLSSGHFPLLGNKDAKITVVEFADLRCPFCDQFFKNTLPSLRKDYIDTGKVQFAFRHFEFLGAASITAGNAIECANEQNRFWDMHDYLYANQPEETDTSMYTTDKLTDIAGQLGMDTTQFRSCLENTKYQKNVDKDSADAKKFQVDATPTLFVNGVRVVGAVPYADLQKVIEQELKKQ